VEDKCHYILLHQEYHQDNPHHKGNQMGNNAENPNEHLEALEHHHIYEQAMGQQEVLPKALQQ
jgi:hypothetical protein